jgi:hypothetical protein
VDGAVDAAAAEQPLVGRIDDGVDVLLRDVAFDDDDPGIGGHGFASFADADARYPLSLPWRGRWRRG